VERTAPGQYTDISIQQPAPHPGQSQPLTPRTVSRGHSVHAVPTRTHYKIIISSTRPGPCCEASIGTKSYVSCVPKLGFCIHIIIITSSHLETLLLWWRGGVVAAVVLCSAVIATGHEFDLRSSRLTQCSVSSIKMSAIAVHAPTVSALCHFQFSVAVNKCLGRHREIGCNNLVLPHPISQVYKRHIFTVHYFTVFTDRILFTNLALGSMLQAAVSFYSSVRAP
jgi:hypothetical protein